MSRVVHFEVPADNTDRAIAFYSAVFGWSFQKWDGPMPYWLVTTGPKEQPGINGGMMMREHPGQGTVNTVDVQSVDESIAAVTNAGGKIALPKMAIPGVGWLADGSDTEGNTFGMMQADPGAK